MYNKKQCVEEAQEAAVGIALGKVPVGHDDRVSLTKKQLVSLLKMATELGVKAGVDFVAEKKAVKGTKRDRKPWAQSPPALWGRRFIQNGMLIGGVYAGRYANQAPSDYLVTLLDQFHLTDAERKVIVRVLRDRNFPVNQYLKKKDN